MFLHSNLFHTIKGSNAAQVTKSNVIMSKVENDEAAPVAE